MKFTDKIKNYFSPKSDNVKPIEKHRIFIDIDNNVNFIKKAFDNSADLTIKNLVLQDNTKAVIITMEGMVNKEVLSLSITTPIIGTNYKGVTGNDKIEFIEESVLTASEVVRISTIEEIYRFSMSGFAIVLIDKATNALAVGIQGFSFRGVAEPESEVVQKGSREGFVEPLRINMTLIRRRMKTPNLKFETITIGEVSQTDICLCYMQDAVSKGILKELKKRLEKTKIDTLLGAGYLSDFLENDEDKSIFSGVGVTERPDTLCGKINEGRIGIMIDGTPSVLIVPHLFVENFQAVDDYTNRAYFATFTRWLKYLAFFVSIFTPAVYVAVATFNPELFPEQLLSKVASSIASTPFSLMTEVLIIHFIYEIMREAGLRLPRPLGHAVSIVGALVIGETAVNAGLIGAPTLMVVALTAISSYVIPDLYPPIAIIRIVFIIVGGLSGVWGIVLLFCIILVNLCGKLSFGIPYMSPISPFSLFGMRDVVVRTNWRILSKKRNLVQEQTGCEQFEEDEC